MSCCLLENIKHVIIISLTSVYEITNEIIGLWFTASKTPKVTIEPEVMSIKAGERAVFYCSATGDPQPNIQWSKENGTLPSKARSESGYLLIPNVDYLDAGTYRCTGVNSLGMFFTTAQLIVDQGRWECVVDINGCSPRSICWAIVDAWKYWACNHKLFILWGK